MFCAQYLQDREQFYIKPQDCVLEQTQVIFLFGTFVVVVSLVSLFLAGSSPTLLQPGAYNVSPGFQPGYTSSLLWVMVEEGIDEFTTPLLSPTMA